MGAPGLRRIGRIAKGKVVAALVASAVLVSVTAGPALALSGTYHWYSCTGDQICVWVDWSKNANGSVYVWRVDSYVTEGGPAGSFALGCIYSYATYSYNQELGQLGCLGTGSVRIDAGYTKKVDLNINENFAAGTCFKTVWWNGGGTYNPGANGHLVAGIKLPSGAWCG